MKSILKKENLKPVIVLSVICLIVAALMGGVNMITDPIIKDREAAAIAESLSSVMPNGDFEEIEKHPDAPKTVDKIYKDKNSGGHVVTLIKQGYASKIKLTVGIGADQKITSVVITSEAETHGKAGIDEMVAELSGKGASAVSGVDGVTGATKTSDYIKAAVYDAFVVLGYAAPADAEDAFDYAGITLTTDSEAIEIAKSLMPGEYERIDTPAGVPTTVRAIYKRSNGGHAIHVATRTLYVPLETEGIVTVDSFGNITGIEMIAWNVGYDKTLLDKAPEFTDEFLDSFIGKNADSLARVDLVTHATLTSNNFTNALEAALSALYPVPVFSIIAVAVIALLALSAIGYGVYLIIKRRKAA